STINIDVSDFDYTCRCCLNRSAHLRGQLFHGGLCALQIEAHSTTEKMIGVDAPKHGVRVAHCDLFAAAPVNNRPRICPGALWPYAQRTASVHPCDAPAACTNRLNIQHTNAQWQSIDFGFRTT